MADAAAFIGMAVINRLQSTWIDVPIFVYEVHFKANDFVVLIALRIDGWQPQVTLISLNSFLFYLSPLISTYK